MAAIADSIIGSVIMKIGERVIQEASFRCGVRGKVQDVQEELSLMKAFLQDKDLIRREGEDVVKNLVANVRDVAYEAEDVIDTFMSRADSNRRRGIIGICPKVKWDVAIFDKFVGKIKILMEKMEKLKQRMLVYYSAREIPDSQSRSQDYIRHAGFAQGKDVIGLEKDTEALMRQLTTGDSRRRVVSIVGIGGAGKTTLANKVYNDGRVKSHFPVYTAWAYVSQAYDPKGILLDIAIQLKVMDSREQNLEYVNAKAVQDRLSAFLKGKKYLIVLDDMWEKEAWNQLNGAFPDGDSGSRVVLTTRSMIVASQADSHPANPPYKLPLLSEKDSWNLFLKKALQVHEPEPEPGMQAGDRQTCPANLKVIGQRILAKCDGLPIAIANIGDQLAPCRGKMEDWEAVLGNLEEHLSRCSKILALSYYDLSPDLKVCFFYLSLFPEKEIHVEKLKMIWIAAGFIQASEKQSKEGRAESCLKELIDKSLIQVGEREWDGTVVKCRIHGLLRDIAVSEARQHHVLEIGVGVSPSIPNTVRHLAINNQITYSHSCSTPRLRSFLCFATSMWKLGDSKFLRVLDLEGVSGLEENMLYVIMKELILLKYLNLKNTKVGTLPLSINHCYNLETLILHYGTRLPQWIWDMEQLRHLYTFACKFEGSPRVDRLRNLQTLCLLAGSWIQQNRLSKLSGLRKLYIGGDVSSNLNALWSSIENLVNLQSLELVEFSSENLILPTLECHSGLRELILEVALERLPTVQEFPQNLTKLYLRKSKLKTDPMPTLEKLMALENLRLGEEAYHGKVMRSSNGFPRLRCLWLECLVNLEEWTVTSGSMPNLESLYIRSCEKLNVPPEGLPLKVYGDPTSVLCSKDWLE